MVEMRRERGEVVSRVVRWEEKCEEGVEVGKEPGEVVSEEKRR